MIPRNQIAMKSIRRIQTSLYGTKVETEPSYRIKKVCNTVEMLLSSMTWASKEHIYSKNYKANESFFLDFLFLDKKKDISRKLGEEFYEKRCQQIFFHDLIVLLKSGKFTELQECLRIMQTWKLIPRQYLNDKISQKPRFQDTQESLRENLIALTLYTGHLHLSTSLIVESASVPLEYTKMAIRMLCIEGKRYKVLLIYSMIRLLNRVPLGALQPAEMEEIMEHIMSVEDDYPTFTNVVFDKFMLDIGISYAFQVLERNLHFGNTPRAIQIWQKHIKHQVTVDNVNARILLKYIERLAVLDKSVLKNCVNELLDVPQEIARLPEVEAAYIKVLGSSLRFKGHFSSFIRQISAPVSRESLGLLFETYMNKHELDTAKKIFQHINRQSITRGISLPSSEKHDFLLGNNGNLNENELDSVVLYFLHGDNHTEALALVKESEYKKPLVRILGYAIAKKLRAFQGARFKKEFELFQNDYENIMSYCLKQLDTFDPVTDVDVYDMVTYKVMEKVLQVYGVFYIRSLYELLERQDEEIDELKMKLFLREKQALDLSAGLNKTGGKVSRGDSFYGDLTTNGLPNLELLRLRPYLTISETQKVPIILLILGRLKSNLSLSSWCINKLVETGIPLAEVMAMYQFHYPKLYKKFFRENANENK